jgi:hypothetical protein
MLYSRPTKHGAGIILLGDESDLRSLLCTIRKIYDGPPFKENLEEFLFDFAHEVDSASSGARTPMPKGHSKPDDGGYNWVVRLWPSFLMELGMLRWAAGFHPTGKGDQANLYALEHCAETALLSYDPVAGLSAAEWLECFTGLPASYLVNFITEVEARYVCASKNGKTRFARLPEFLRMLQPFSPEYEAFEEQMEAIARERGCKPNHLERESFPRFAW